MSSEGINGFERNTWSRNSIVSMDTASQTYFSSIDFADLKMSNNTDHKVIIYLTLNHKVFHTVTTIDQCCVFNKKSIEYDGIDNLNRISCKIPSKKFKNDYVNKRQIVMLTDCQDNWQARNWTFSKLLNRYPASEWTTVYNVDEDQECKSGDLKGKRILDLIGKGYYVRVFHQLNKSLKGWQRHERSLKLDLLDEYSHPEPFPKDIFGDIYADSDQAYVMLATNGTGR